MSSKKILVRESSTSQLTLSAFPDLKARLQGAKIDGFEGVKMLQLKLNRKLKAKGESSVNLQEECASDLELRRDSQYTLFSEIINYYAPPVI